MPCLKINFTANVLLPFSKQTTGLNIRAQSTKSCIVKNETVEIHSVHVRVCECVCARVCVCVCVHVCLCVSFRYSLLKPEHSNLTHPSPWRVRKCSAWEEFLSYLLIREKLILSCVVCSCILPLLLFPSSASSSTNTSLCFPHVLLFPSLPFSPLSFYFSGGFLQPLLSGWDAINCGSYWPARRLMRPIQWVTRDL